jgi:hypothetical protein
LCYADPARLSVTRILLNRTYAVARVAAGFLPAAAWYFLIQSFSYLRSQSANTKKNIKIKYRSAEGYESISDATA